MNRLKKLGLLLLILVMIIGCDQVSKKVAQENLSSINRISYLGDTFRFQYIENDGAFLSLGSGWPISIKILVLNILPVILLFSIFFYLLRSNKLDSYSFIGLSLVLGGGIGNLWDRILNNGWVVDFMNIGIGSLRSGIFNFADVFIMCGFSILFISLYKNKYRKPC